MNEGSQIQLPAGNANALTITEAADAVGVETFTMLSFIQRGKVNATRSSSGEITVPAAELANLTKKGG